MNEIAEAASTKVDAGLALLIIAFTGIICFWIGLMTPFVILKLKNMFRLEFGEFFDKDDEEAE